MSMLSSILRLVLGVLAVNAASAMSPVHATEWKDFARADASVNGTVIHYRMAGKGVPIVLMHGWVGTSHTWRKVAPILAQHHVVIVPDMRGNGDSQKPEKGYDARTMGNDIRALLTQLGISKAFVAGFDMSAPVAYVYAADYPDEVFGIMYLDEPLLHVNLDALTLFSSSYLPGGAWWWGFNYTPGLAELLITGREKEFVTSRFSYGPGDLSSYQELIDEVSRGLKSPNGIGGSLGWYRAGYDSIAQMRAAKVRVPVLAVGGQFALSDTYAQMKSVVPTAEGGILPKAGHHLQEDQPEALAKMMLEFMEKHAK